MIGGGNAGLGDRGSCAELVVPRRDRRLPRGGGDLERRDGELELGGGDSEHDLERRIECGGSNGVERRGGDRESDLELDLVRNGAPPGVLDSTVPKINDPGGRRLTLVAIAIPAVMGAEGYNFSLSSPSLSIGDGSKFPCLSSTLPGKNPTPVGKILPAGPVALLLTVLLLLPTG